MAATATPDTEISTDLWAEINSISEDLYEVIVHDDDVTTFATVITALVQLFGHSIERAKDLANEVHTTGRATADVLPKEEAEAAVKGLHSFKIRASMEKASL